MDREAILNLRRVVETAPEELLHMRKMTEQASCGTAHCALGWARIDPWFKVNKSSMVAFTSQGYNSASAAHAFGITEATADLLFAGDASSGIEAHAISKAEVLWNIDHLLDKGFALAYEALREDIEYQEIYADIDYVPSGRAE